MKNVVVILSAVLALAVPFGLSAQTKSVIIERVLVRVNGEIFTQSQLTERQINVLRDRKAQVNDPKAIDSDAALRTQLAEVTPDILVTVVDELLLVQHGRELGLKFTDAQFASAIENVKKQNKLDDASFKIALQQEGMTLEQLRQDFERTYLAQAVQSQEVGPRIQPTQEELRQYYNAHQSEFMTRPSVTLREIFFTVQVQNQGGREVFEPGSDAAAKDKVDRVIGRLRAGDDFAALAKEVSDSPTKATGGLIGSLALEDINPGLRAMLETRNVGDVADPIRTPRGYQLLKIEARGESTLEPFDKVNTRIEQRIREERIGAETQKLLERLRGQAIMDWKDQELKAVYEKRLSELLQ